MKLALRTRVVLAMVLSGVVAVVATSMAVEASLDRGRTAQWSLPPGDLAACRAAPATWSPHVGDLVTAYAYDADGRSAHPDAPEMSAEVLAALRQDGSAEDVDRLGRAEIRRVAPDGPCTYLRIAFRPPGDFDAALQNGLMLGAVLALVLVVGLALGFVLQPLLVRIRNIRRAAEAVGGPGFTPIVDEVPDALGTIAEVLTRSHARIRANEVELEERRLALERHLAEIAHDLRTPLASLLLAVQELAPSSAPGDKALRRALDDAEYVNALVDNLHQGTILRRGLQLAPDARVDLREIVERLEARFCALGALRGFHFAASVPDAAVWARGVPALAERAIANLVHNAVRHGRAEGHVAVLLEVSDTGFELAVVDDGPGLRAEVLADLAAATFRTDAARPRSEGLGLTISNEAARAFGWEIHFETETPHGLRVTLRGEKAG